MKNRPSYPLFIAACLAAPGSAAFAQTTQAQCETITLQGMNDQSGIDRQVPRELAVSLSHPPHSSYNSWRMLNRGTHAATVGQPFGVQLPNANTIQVTWRVGPRNDQAVLEFGLQEARRTNVVPLVQSVVRWGEFILVGGQRYRGTHLVLATRCTRGRASVVAQRRKSHRNTLAESTANATSPTTTTRCRANDGAGGGTTGGACRGGSSCLCIGGRAERSA